MTSLDGRSRLLAASLAALAGYVDAVGFIGSGGFFVSFMSGNSTRLAVGVVRDPGVAAIAFGLITAFMSGVVGGALVGARAGGRRPAAVLALVTLGLTLAAVGAALASPFLTFCLVAFAMGAVNMLFDGQGEVRLGLTYMTGTLVRIGQRVAVAIDGGDRWGWMPHLQLWLSLVAGAVAGSVTFARVGTGGLWIAAAIAAGLTITLWRKAARSIG